MATTTQFAEPIEIENIGIVQGRDAIYIDGYHFSGRNDFFIEGAFNSQLCSVKQDIDFVPFKISFRGIIHLKFYELDLYYPKNMWERKASFEMIQDSDLIKEFMILNDSQGKINENHKHYILWTYDDVFEVVADGYDITIHMDNAV